MFNFGILGTIPREEVKKLDARLALHDSKPWKAWALNSLKPKKHSWSNHEPIWFVWCDGNFLNYEHGVNDDVILEIISEEYVN